MRQESCCFSHVLLGLTKQLIAAMRRRAYLSPWHGQQLTVGRDGNVGIVLQQLSQLGVGTVLTQDHIVPIGQLVQHKVSAALSAPAGEDRGVGGGTAWG